MQSSVGCENMSMKIVVNTQNIASVSTSKDFDWVSCYGESMESEIKRGVHGIKNQAGFQVFFAYHT